MESPITPLTNQKLYGPDRSAGPKDLDPKTITDNQPFDCTTFLEVLTDNVIELPLFGPSFYPAFNIAQMT